MTTSCESLDPPILPPRSESLEFQTMKFHCLRPAELSVVDRRRWEELRTEHVTYESPYFHPDFTRCVGEVRRDVEVAVFESDAGPCGYFPFQRRGRQGRPVGGRLSDFQGMIVEPARVPSGVTLLKGCGLDVYDFDHWLGWQAGDFGSVAVADEAVAFDLSGGWSGYERALATRGSEQIAKGAQKARACERQFGPLRFELDSREDSLLELLFTWKSRQYRATGLTDVFHRPWTRDLVRRIHAHREGDFGGLLSVLYAGDRVAALHFGLRSATVWHAWFPAYDPELGKYSPGATLWLRLAREAAARGVDRLDLGRSSPWKTRFSTTTCPVVEGSCDLRPIRGACRRIWRATKSWVKASPLRSPARIPGAIAYRIRDWFEFQ